MSCWRCIAGSDLAPIAPAWEDAARRAPGSVFQTFPFARCWAEVFGQDVDVQVWSDGQLILPVAFRGSTLMPLGEGLFDYIDVIGAAGCPAAEQSRAAAWIARRSWSSLQITGVRTGSPFTAFWHRLGGGGEAFTAAPRRHPSDPEVETEHRHAAARWRRAQRLGAHLDHPTQPAEQQRLLHWMLERKAQLLTTHGQTNVLGALEQRWLERMLESAPTLVELWSLRLRDRLMSGLLCWRFNSTRYAYMISYDPELAQLSPGILLLFAVVRLTMSAGLYFDFLTGEQAFKQRFATHRETLWRFRRQRDQFRY